MVGCCSACGNRVKKGSGISFHRFPLSNAELLAKWLSALNRENFEPTHHHKLCSLHFTESCFWKSKGQRLLKTEAVPTIFSTVSKKDRSSRHMQSLKRKLEPESSSSNELNEMSSPDSVTNEHDYTLSECEIDIVKSEPNGNYKPAAKKSMVDTQGKLKLSIARLKRKSLIDKHTLSVLNNNFSEDMLDLVYRACSEENSDYSELLRKFAVTVHFYCPAAYQCLQLTVDRPLPRINNIRKWCTSRVAEPGFTDQALHTLKELVLQTPHQLCVSLMFDEMSISRDIQWDGSCFIGEVDLGEGVCVNDYDEAREVLVLMAVAVNAPWKIPIAYYLINELSAKVRANIVREAILRLQKIKINVLAVTCKGGGANLAVGEKLGCNFMAEALDCSFNVGGQSIQFMLDPHHLINILRTVFCRFRVLKDQNGQVIDCRYIELLQKVKQNSEVSLLPQVPSAAIGMALSSAAREMKQFKGALPTAEFCVFFDKLFALFTSKSRLGKGYNATLSSGNKGAAFDLLDYAESYLLGMRDEYERPLYHTIGRIAIIGFLTLCRGIRNIYMEAVETKHVEHLATYKFSIENLELFFNQIQSKLLSEIPKALEFKEAYKEMISSGLAKSHKSCFSESVKKHNAQ